MGSRRTGFEENRMEGENEPKWKRRIQGDIKRLRQDLNLLEIE